MDVRQIEAYHAVMTYGTTSRAADVLSISQPAVSKAVMALERTIGFGLFDREKGRMVPTAEGQLFFREVQDTFTGLARSRYGRATSTGSPFVALAPEDTTRREAEAIFARCGVAPRIVVETAYSSGCSGGGGCRWIADGSRSPLRSDRASRPRSEQRP